jgi:hypothetical protein
MPAKLRRNLVLKYLDIKTNPDGSQVVFSAAGHVYPVNIDLILEYNSMEVIL